MTKSSELLELCLEFNSHLNNEEPPIHFKYVKLLFKKVCENHNIEWDIE